MKFLARSFAVYTLSICIAHSFPVSSKAQFRDWANSTNGSWFTASDWNPADVPNTNSEIARFNAGGTYEIFHFGGSTNVGGIDWTDPGATLSITAIPSSTSSMTVGSDFTINGTLNMTSNVTGVGVFFTRNGMVSNATGGTVNFNGTSSVVRQFSVDSFDNDGIVNVDGNTRFTTTGTVVTNNNAINIAAGTTLDFGSNATFNQNGGTLDNQGTFAFSNDTLNFNGGNFTGNDIELFNSTLNNNTTGTGVFNLTGSGNFYSGDLVAGQELNLLATPSSSHVTTATADFSNFSTINVTSNVMGVGVTLTRTGSITNAAAGTINLDGTSSALRNLNVNTFDNDGIVNVDGNTRFTATGTVVTNNNAINIAADTTLDFGSNATFNQNAGTLDNQGTFAFSNDTLNFNGGNFTGNAIELFNSTLNNNTAGTGVFNLTGSGNFYSGDLVAGQELNLLATPSSSHGTTATADFSNFSTINVTSNVMGVGVTLTRAGMITNAAAGTINLDGTSSALRNLNVNIFDNDGIVNVDGNTRFTATGTVVTNNNAINIAAGTTLDFGSNAIFNQNAGTLHNQGTFAFSNDTLNFNGGNFTGNDIELFNSTLSNNTTGTGVFNLTGGGNFYSGDLVAGQELNLLATPSSSHGTTATADFSNFSTINVTSNVIGVGVTLTRTGSITNAAAGTINLDGTSSALRNLNVNTFDNDGIVNVDGNTRFTATGTVVTNNNAINIAAGTTLDFGSNAIFNQNAGTLDNQGTFAFINDRLNFNGGNFTGNAIELFNSTLNNNTAGTGVFNLTGSGNFYSGDLVAGQELNLLATPSSSHGTTATADFSNFSTINVTSNVMGVGVALTRPGGSALEKITNASGGIINFDGTASASRRIVAAIDNQGQIDNFASGIATEIGNSASDHLNSGTITNRNSGSLFLVNGDSFTNLASGTLAGLGEFDFSDTGLLNAGTIAPGLSAGSLALDGNTTFTSTSNLIIELGGTVAGIEYDQLQALDSLSLGGQLSVSFISGFDSLVSNSDIFSIVNAGSLSGTFAGLADGDRFLTIDGLGSFEINYGGNSVVLSNYEAVPEPGTGLALSVSILGLLIRHRRYRRSDHPTFASHRKSSFGIAEQKATSPSRTLARHLPFYRRPMSYSRESAQRWLQTFLMP